MGVNETCPRCGSTDPAVRLTVLDSRAVGEGACTGPWHDRPTDPFTEQMEHARKAFQTLDTVADLIADPQGIKTLVFDAISGFERQCNVAVCDRDFKGDFGDKGFSSFQRGYDIAAMEWHKLLAALDTLRLKQGVNVMILGHIQIKPFKNPDGADFDRFVPDVHHKLWSPTFKWADAVLFGRYLTVIDKEQKGKGKGIGGTERVVYTQRRDAFDAKNRFAMPEAIDVPNDPSLMFSTIFAHITK
jgi:hypothetical protein